MPITDSKDAPSSSEGAEKRVVELIKGNRGPEFEIVKYEKYLFLRFYKPLGTGAVKEFEILIQTSLTQWPELPIVISCERISEFPKFWIRALVSTCLKLKSKNIEHRFILVGKHLANSFNADGVDSIFKVCASLREALVDLKVAVSGTIDVTFLNPFLNATIKGLQVQCNTLAQAQKPHLKVDRTQSLGDISAIVGVVSSSYSGNVILSFPKETLLSIVSQMFGEEYKEITAEVESGAGEIANIIFGQAKLDLNALGYAVLPAIPTVISGDTPVVHGTGAGPVIVLPFLTKFGLFYLEICLSK